MSIILLIIMVKITHTVSSKKEFINKNSYNNRTFKETNSKDKSDNN